MKIVFTCGGTAGHINPAVALARMFRERHPQCEVLFVGADGGMEVRLLQKEGLPLKTVTISSFYRSLSPSAIRHNLHTLANLGKSDRQAKAILDDFQPDLVVGTGGYASFPLVKAAARRGIPTAIHESNAFPGLTTVTLSRLVDVVMVGFEESRAHYKHAKRVVVTGTPVREDFFRLSKRDARKTLNIPEGFPLVLSFWGSLGARVMNEHMVGFIALSAGKTPSFYHIHGGGRSFDTMKQQLNAMGVNAECQPYLELREYIYDMPTVMAAADLVLCRAGASTIAELTALAKPCILVPSPNVVQDHQTKNAQIPAQAGGAILLPEEACTPRLLHETVQSLLTDEKRLASMSHALSSLSAPDANERIYQTLLALLR